MGASEVVSDPAPAQHERQPDRRPAKGAATLKLPIEPAGKARASLAKSGKAKLAVSVTFAPTGGTAKSKAKTVVRREK